MLATNATLLAQGTCQTQLKVHFHAALNVGCTDVEGKAIIIHMAINAGFPAASSGMFGWKKCCKTAYITCCCRTSAYS